MVTILFLKNWSIRTETYLPLTARCICQLNGKKNNNNNNNNSNNNNNNNNINNNNNDNANIYTG